LIYLRNTYPSHKDTAKKIIIQAVTFIVFISATTLALSTLEFYLPRTDNDSFSDDYFDSLIKSGITLGIITICYECAYYFGKWETSMYESERLKKEQLVSQFELLKTQISPHFLFNSLNALMALVPEDTHLSVLFIQKLSNVYRHMLNYSEKHLIDLKEEMIFLQDYLFLYQIRFGENLIINYNLPADLLHIQVIPFSLQILVENSIKHNIISNRKPLRIDISSDGEVIVVRNNLQKKTSGVESTNIE
jgi:sensor histidine kinase YesM